MLGSVGKEGIVKKLWALQASQSAGEDGWPAEAYRVFKSLMKSRESKELKNFVATMKNGGAEDSACWMLPNRSVEVAGKQVSPAVICARLFRWPDVRSSDQVHRLATCPCSLCSEASKETCCNPFHFGKVVSIEVPPIPIDRRETTATAVRLPGEGSTNDSAFYDCTTSTSAAFSDASFSDKCVDLPSTDGERFDSECYSQPASESSSSWLSMAYWEMNNRIGRQFRVSDSVTSVSYEGTSGFVLSKIKDKSRSDVVERKRRLFGRGFELWREGEDIWLYNRSEHSVFVQSPTLSSPTGTRQVHRITSGQAIKVFSRDQADLLLLYMRKHSQLRFPFDVFSFRVSLVSGWGERHTRQNIMQCPCWLEFFLSF